MGNFGYALVQSSQLQKHCLSTAKRCKGQCYLIGEAAIRYQMQTGARVKVYLQNTIKFAELLLVVLFLVFALMR